MGYNIFELLSKYNQFKQMLNTSKQNPEKLLEDELKRRNINQQQLKELLNEARSLQQIFGVR